MRRSPSATVLAAIVALIFISAALVVGIAYANENRSASVIPFVAQILGIIAIVIPVLVAANRAETLSDDLKNGGLQKNVKPAVKDALDEYDFADDIDLTPLAERLAERLAEPPEWDGTERRTNGR